MNANATAARHACTPCITPSVRANCLACTSRPVGAAGHAHPARAAQRGFTLIELMATVSIAGVLSSVALPSAEGVLHKARRSDALVATAQVQLAQEAFRGQAATYGSLSEIRVPARSPAGHYTLDVSAPGPTGYVLLATATGAQARDAACRVLRLTSNGLNVERASGPDAGVANDAAANRRCWSL